MGKSHRRSFPPSTDRASKPLELVHADLFELPHLSIDGYKYMATFLDDCSSYGCGIMLKKKTDVYAEFRTFHQWACNQLNTTMKGIRSDRGPEYMGDIFQGILHEFGIEHQTSTPEDHEQNGRAERWQRTVAEKGTAMLHHAGMSQGFWKLAFEAAIYVLNRQPTKVQNWKTPIEAFLSKKPDVSNFRVFGCHAYIHIIKKKRKGGKTAPKGKSVIFVGYESGSKPGWIFWNPATRRVESSGDAEFHEDFFPRRDQPDSTGRNRNLPPLPSNQHDEDHFAPPDLPSDDEEQQRPLMPRGPGHAPQGPPPPPQDGDSDSDSDDEDPKPRQGERPQPGGARGDNKPSSSRPDPNQSTSSQPSSSSRAPGPSVPGVVPDVPQAEQPQEQAGGSHEPRRSQRVPQANTRYKGFVRSDDPDLDLDSIDLSALEPENFLMALAKLPQNYNQAMRSSDADKWLSAMQDEMASHEENGTWKLVPLPKDRKALGNRWVFDVKRDNRYKARLVVQGFLQRHMIDYNETFSPVARFESVRIILAFAALHDWEIEAMDVKTAYLNGDLDEVIYMRQPEGFIVKGKETHVCLLKKSLYGLKQAGRQWYKKLHSVLVSEELCFTRTHSDAGIYIHRSQGGEVDMILIVYVDDLLLIGPSTRLIQEVKKKLSSRFKMKDLGPASDFIALSINRDRARRLLWIHQSNYIRGFLEFFQMSTAKGMRTPLPPGLHLQKFDGEATAETRRWYQSVVGSILYAMIGTRPDVAYAVIRLSQYNSNPGPEHVTAVRHLMKYMVGTQDYALVFDGNMGDRLIGYSDADYGENRDHRHSITGNLFYLAGAAVTWTSKEQKSVALSSAESEYYALTNAAKQCLWLRRFVMELGDPYAEEPTILYTDNQAAQSLSTNPIHDSRTKHIDIRYHFIREFVDDGKAKILWKPTDEMIADDLTKPLAPILHNKFRTLMGLRPVSGI